MCPPKKADASNTVQVVLLRATLSEKGTHLAALLWAAEWAPTNATRLGKRKHALVARKRTKISDKADLFSEPLPSEPLRYWA
jgi:hypothetical protein